MASPCLREWVLMRQQPKADLGKDWRIIHSLSFSSFFLFWDGPQGQEIHKLGPSSKRKIKKKRQRNLCVHANTGPISTYVFINCSVTGPSIQAHAAQIFLCDKFLYNFIVNSRTRSPEREKRKELITGPRLQENIGTYLPFLCLFFLWAGSSPNTQIKELTNRPKKEREQGKGTCWLTGQGARSASREATRPDQQV